MRERALWLRWISRRQLLHPRPLAAVAGQPLEHLELAHPEPELVQRVVERDRRPRMPREQVTPVAYEGIGHGVKCYRTHMLQMH